MLGWGEVLRQLPPVRQPGELEQQRQPSTALSETLRASVESSEQEADPHLKLSWVVALPVYLAECLAAIVDIVVRAFEIGTTDTKPGSIGKVKELRPQLELHFFPKCEDLENGEVELIDPRLAQI